LVFVFVSMAAKKKMPPAFLSKMKDAKGKKGAPKKGAAKKGYGKK
jgi:hypothetical protein